jgi:RNA polymerase sigma-70 factor (sigma-E family)
MEPDVIEMPGSRLAGSRNGSAARSPRAVSSGEVLAGLFSQHYVTLVRLTVVLLRDLTAAEAVVQDAFVAMHQRRLQDPDQALAYLRRAVVNGSRSALRHRATEDWDPPPPPSGMPRAEHGAMVRLEASAVAAALGTLPRWQREAVVLRYYADLSETETAAAMGISESAVHSHALRGIAALRQRLDGGEAPAPPARLPGWFT